MKGPEQRTHPGTGAAPTDRRLGLMGVTPATPPPTPGGPWEGLRQLYGSHCFFPLFPSFHFPGATGD